MNQSRIKYGQHIHETRLQGQTYFEAYEEKLSDSLSYPETLAQVISLAEENKQKALTPEVSRQMELHLDNALTIQTKRRFLSAMPATIQELRNKHQVMSHMWPLAQMRQLARPLYADLKETTFTKFLDESLSEKNFLLEREIAGTRMIVPNWTRMSSRFAKRHSNLRVKKDNLWKERYGPRPSPQDRALADHASKSRSTRT